MATVVALEVLTVETFAPSIGQVYKVMAGSEEGAGVALTLKSVELSKWATEGRSRPFSLIFAGPVEPLLSQRIYPLVNEAFGEIEMFLVPVGADSAGCRYEAVFN